MIPYRGRSIANWFFILVFVGWTFDTAPIFAAPLWQDSQLITGSGLSPSDHFGTSVALDSDTAIVSSLHLDDDGGQGHAYVYHKNPSQQWSEVAKLSPADGSTAGFGKSVAVSRG